MKGKRKHTPVRDGFAKATGGSVLKDGAKILEGGVIAKGHRDVMNIDLASMGKKGGKKGNVLDFGF